MSEENKNIVRAIERAWNSDSTDSLPQYFAANFHQHNGVPGMPDSLESALAAHGMSKQAFPDRQTSIEDIVAEGDDVVVRMRMTGTNKGGLPWFGIPANDAPVNVEWIGIYTVKDGKVTEHRAVMDVATLMQQLGAMPSA
jgi:predicted ester cyclase